MFQQKLELFPNWTINYEIKNICANDFKLAFQTISGQSCSYSVVAIGEFLFTRSFRAMKRLKN